MKKRRIAIVAFLLCACMVIGIGYAAVSKNLDVLGTVNVGNSALNVTFTDAGKDADVDDNFCTDAVVLDGDVQARMTTTVMSEKGQTAVAYFIITNNMTDTDVSITHLGHSFTGALNENYFDVEREFTALDEEDGLTFGTDDEGKPTVTKLPATKSVKLTITITLNQELTQTLSGDRCEFTGQFLATALN